MQPKRIAEYGTYSDALRSKKTILERRAAAYGRTCLLSHSTPGYEPAGSCARWTDERWTAGHTDSNGAFYGQSFKSEHEARSYFEKWSRKYAV
jgi:hypothetical protein